MNERELDLYTSRRTRTQLDVPAGIASLMTFTGRGLLVVAIGAFAFYAAAGGLGGLLAVLVLLGPALVPWLFNGSILISWGRSLAEREPAPRTPRSLALFSFGAFNVALLSQLVDIDGPIGALGVALMCSAALADLLGGVAIAATRPSGGQAASGSRVGAWALAFCACALVVLVLASGGWAGAVGAQ